MRGNMYCPSCGANQAEGRRFCTNCGTNLWVVSQALSAPPRAGEPNQPLRPDPREAARQRELASGVKLALIGGAFVALQFFSFIFSLPFRRGGSTFGFWGFVALVLMAIGISKIIKARPVGAPPAPRPQYEPPAALPPERPRPVFSVDSEHATGTLDPALRTTPRATPSVTEDETQHLPGK